MEPVRLTENPSFGLSKSGFDGSALGEEGSGESVGDGSRSKARRGMGRRRGGFSGIVIVAGKRRLGISNRYVCFGAVGCQGSIRLPTVGRSRKKKKNSNDNRDSQKAHRLRMHEIQSKTHNRFSCWRRDEVPGRRRGVSTAVLRTEPRSLRQKFQRDSEFRSGWERIVELWRLWEGAIDLRLVWGRNTCS